MVFSFSPMAFGDVAWFSAPAGLILSAGEFIASATVTADPGITVNPATITLIGTPANTVACQVTAGSLSVTAFLHFHITTNLNDIFTRSGSVTVLPIVPN